MIQTSIKVLLDSQKHENKIYITYKEVNHQKLFFYLNSNACKTLLKSIILEVNII
jgi:hypothetical protein